MKINVRFNFWREINSKTNLSKLSQMGRQPVRLFVPVVKTRKMLQHFLLVPKLSLSRMSMMTLLSFSGQQLVHLATLSAERFKE